MKKFLFLLTTLASLNLVAQSVQDTIDNDYWSMMMADRNVSIHKAKRAYDLYFSAHPKVKGTGWKIFERWYENQSHKVDANGLRYPSDHLYKELVKYRKNNLTPRSASGTWTNLGPFKNPASPTALDVGIGRISSIGFHNTNPNIIFAGSAQGGFWRSYNKGVSWISTTDNMATLGVNDIIFIKKSPTDSLILIGTGDRDGNDADGMGVFKSIDGGVSFTPSNAGISTLTVNKILLNPLKNSTIVAATSAGIYLSYNYGVTWTLKSVNKDFTDIKYCPDDTTHIYATSKQDFSGSATFYRSTNGGSTFNSIGTGLSGNSRKRMVLAVTPSNSNYLYLVAANANNGLEAVYLSVDKGNSFTQKQGSSFNLFGSNPDGTSSGGQGWYDIAAECSMTNSTDLFVGGVNIFKSSNSGATFSAISHWTGQSAAYCHADCHVLTRNPLNPIELYVGTDGGFDISPDNGSTFVSRNDGLSIGQIYNIGTSQKSKTRFIAGFQDNGTSFGSSTTSWSSEIGGDGMQCEISQLDTTKMFGTVQYGKLMRSTNNGGTWQDLTGNISEYNGSNNWVMPYHLHPRINDIMVAVYRNVFVSKNVITGSAGFSKVSNFTSGKEGTSIRFSNINDDLVFMGWENGDFGYINNLSAGTPTVTMVTNPTGNPTGYTSVSDIETSYVNDNIVYCTAGNKVYRSSGKGSGWIDITSNLPNIPMNCIVTDKNMAEALYVGTDLGVYYKDSTMTNWVKYNNGMPDAASIRDLEIVYDTTCSSKSVIYAATYGRGLWKGDLRISETEPRINFGVPVGGACANQLVDITDSTTATIGGVGNMAYQWTITPSAGVTYTSGTDNTTKNPIVTFTNPGNYSITLKGTKSYGGFCKATKTNILNIGNNGSLSFKHLDTASICPGDSFLIKTTGMPTITISPMTGITKINDSVFLAQPLTSEDYTVTGSFSGSCAKTKIMKITALPAPNYGLSVDTVFCEGDSSILDIIGTDVDSSYLTPTTFTTRLDKVSHIVKPAISTNYTLRLTKPGICDIKIPLNFNVQTKPTYAFNAPKSKTMCKGDSFVITETNNIPSKQWTPSSYVTALTSHQFSFKPLVSTDYVVNSFDNTICPDTKDTIKLTVLTIPDLTIIGKKEFCKGQSVLLIAKDKNNGATSFNWSPNKFLNTNSNDSVICNADTTITYSITANNGICNQTISQTLVVGTSKVNLSLIGDTNVCKGIVRTLIASGGSTYNWIPGQNFNNQFRDTVRLTTDTNMKIKVFGYKTGCIDSIEKNIMVRSQPIITNTLNPTSSICAGDSVTLSTTGALTYTIDPLYKVTNISNGVFKLKPFIPTNYTIYGSSQYGCTGKLTTLVDVNPIPTVTVNPPTSTINRGTTLNIVASGGVQYEWTPNKYFVSSNVINNINVRPDSNIIYKVKVTSQFGCVSNGLAIINVLQVAQTNGVSNSSLSNILVYPIPTSDELNINSIQDLDISIYDQVGKLISEFKKDREVFKIDVSQFPVGDYFIILLDKNKQQISIKINITR